MMDSNQVVQLKNVFDQIVHITEDGIEFWYARELQSALGYTRWENFVNAIEKAKVSCASSGRDVDGCFRDVTKTSPILCGIYRAPLLRQRRGCTPAYRHRGKSRGFQTAACQTRQRSCRQGRS